MAKRQPDTVTTNPDPTSNVRELVEAAILRIDNLREARSQLFDKALSDLEALTSARFESVAREFALIESRRIEQKVDTKTAVDAALSAAEKAVKEQQAASEKSILKSETAAAEQSKQQNATFTAALKGVTDGFSDLKERVGKFETQSQARADGRTDSRLNMGSVVGVIMAVFAFVSLAITVIVILRAAP